MPLAAVIGIGAISSIAGGAIAAHGAGKAAQAQVDAANAASQVERQNAVDALNFEKQQYGNSLRILNPYLQTGYGALDLLRTGLGIGGPSPQGFTLDNPNTANPPQDRFDRFPNGFNPIARDEGPGFNRFRALSGRAPFADNTIDGGPLTMSEDGTLRPTNAMVPRFRGGINSVAGPGGPFSLPGTGMFSTNGAGGGEFSTNFGGGAVQPFQGGASVPGGTNAAGPNMTFGSLLAPFSEKFTAPTDVTEQNDPGYKFRLQQGLDTLQNSAAARGGLLSGGTAKAINDYAQGQASGEYGNVYNRALNEYLNRYNIFTGNQSNQFNKLAAISGMGQTSANQLSTAGLTTGQNVGNTLMTLGGELGQNLTNAGAARASGYVGGANALSGTVGGLGNLAMLYAMLKNQGGGGAQPSGWGVV